LEPFLTDRHFFLEGKIPFSPIQHLCTHDLRGNFTWLGEAQCDSPVSKAKLCDRAGMETCPPVSP
jgi:hypothetical protein